MADNDDKRDESGAGGKKTLTLKAAPGMGLRPNVARSSRNTVVVEKRTRFVPPIVSHRPSAQPAITPVATPAPQQARPQLRASAPQVDC